MMIRGTVAQIVLAAVLGWTGAAQAETLPSAEAVKEVVQAAADAFTGGNAREALTLLEELSAQLGEAGRREHPLVDVLLARCLATLGRSDEALDAVERALAWSAHDPGAREHAERLRAELVATAFASVEVTCGEGVERVRLVERAETQDCPGWWPTLAPGRWTFEGLPMETGRPVAVVEARAGHARHLMIRAVSVRHAPAAIASAEIAPTDAVARDADPPKREGGPGVAATVAGGDVEADRTWRIGARAGGGISGITERNELVVRTESAFGWRLSTSVETPRRWGLGLAAEASLSKVEMAYGTADRAAESISTLSWLIVDAAVLGRACVEAVGLVGCLVPGVSLGWLAAASEERDGEERRVASSAPWHLGVRAGFDVRLPVGAIDLVVGAHGSWSRWPGALELADGSLAAARGWIELGVVY